MVSKGVKDKMTTISSQLTTKKINTILQNLSLFSQDVNDSQFACLAKRGV